MTTRIEPGARSRLFYRVRVHRGRKGERRSMSEADYAQLVTAAHTRLAAPVILIWDNLNAHISERMRARIEAHGDWLTVERLPAYAELNAVEGARAQMKNSLGNLAARDVSQLAAIVQSPLKRRCRSLAWTLLSPAPGLGGTVARWYLGRTGSSSRRLPPLRVR